MNQDPSQSADRMRWGMAVLLVTAGVLLPPGQVAELAGAPTPAGLVGGLWLFKALLVFHGIAVAAMPRLVGTVPQVTGPTRHSSAAVIALLLTGLLLRLPGLGDGLWFDEIQTLVDYVSEPWSVLLTTFDSTNQHLLYSIAARAASMIVPDTAVALRLPAVIFGVLSLWAVVAFGRRWLPPAEAWWSAVLLAVSYHHIWFSQNARGYTGILLGTLIGTTVFVDLLRGRAARPGGVWRYAVVMALTVLTHVTALVVVAGHGLVWLWQARRLDARAARWPAFAALVLSGTIAVMCYAPLLPQLLTAVSESGTSQPGVEWKRPAWFALEALLGLMRGFPAGIVLVPAALGVVAFGWIRAWRNDRVITALATLPMALLGGALLAAGHNLWPRFFFFAAGFVVQWAVHGGFGVLEAVVPRHARRIGDVGLAALTVASLLLLPRAWAPKQDFPAARAWLAEHAAPGDVVAGSAMMELPMNEWLRAGWPIISDSLTLESLERTANGVWVAYVFPIRVQAAEPGLWRALQERYVTRTVIPATIGGGEIIIARRSAADSLQRTRASDVPAPNQ